MTSSYLLHLIPHGGAGIIELEHQLELSEISRKARIRMILKCSFNLLAVAFAFLAESCSYFCFIFKVKSLQGEEAAM